MLYFPYQAARGQLELFRAAQPIDSVLNNEQVDERTRMRLALARDALNFAEDVLALDPKGNYQRYAALGRPHVVWNVFSAPEFSTELKRHCFPVAGCVTYRGYFQEADAKTVAAKMRRRGFDTVVVGVSAYSTLGWFKDPLLNTFLLGTEERLLRVLFHELAHLTVYVSGDTDWNESYASAVSELGFEAFRSADALGLPASTADISQSDVRRRQIETMILATRAELSELYLKGLGETELRREKAEVISSLKTQYQRERGNTLEMPYQGLMAGPVNNASLALVQSYSGLKPRFMALFKTLGSDFGRFQAALKTLSSFDVASRRDPNLWQSVSDTLNQESASASNQ